MAPLPNVLAGLGRAGLLHSAAATRRAYVTAATHVEYERKARVFLRFCDSVGAARIFHPDTIIIFFEMWLLDGGKVTTLPNFLSAWRDVCDERHMYFPPKGSLEWRYIGKYLRGARMRYPHVARRSTPLTLSLIRLVLADVGVTHVHDYETCSIAVLSFCARLLVAHAAMMRTCAHTAGCTVGDVSQPSAAAGRFFLFRVGYSVTARKIKLRPARSCILPRITDVLSCGYALHVLLRRAHGRPSAPGAVLFPRTGSDRRPLPWLDMRAAVRAALRPHLSRVGAPLTTIDGRSLRAGGATDWFSADAPRWWVKSQGGWLSDAVDIYNRPTPVARFRSAPARRVLRVAYDSAPCG